MNNNVGGWVTSASMKSKIRNEIWRRDEEGKREDSLVKQGENSNEFLLFMHVKYVN